MLKLKLFLICLCAGILLAKPAIDESAAKNFIVESGDKFSELYNIMAKKEFDLKSARVDSMEVLAFKSNLDDFYLLFGGFKEDTNAFSNFLAYLNQNVLLGETITNITILSDEVYSYPEDQITDEEIKIGILKLKTSPGLLVLGEDYNILVDNFMDLLEYSNFCKYNTEEEECKTTRDELNQILKNSENPEEILHYWKQWREKNVSYRREKIEEYIDLYQKLGKKLDKSAKFAWFRTYLDENFDDEMEKVMNELEPLFKELHAYVRYILHEKYGDVVPATGLIPHHLYEQAMAQAWKPNSVVAKEFAGVKMPIENNFKESPKEVLEIASNFMKSLGLSEISPDFWSKRAKQSNEDSDHECGPQIFAGGNITYLLYCKEVNIKTFFQIHRSLARIYYANERKNISFAYKDSYNLDLATGEAVILSATTPKYLNSIGHKDVAVLPENEDMNRLFRMGVNTLLNIPEYFVNSKVFADVLDNKVPLTEMNKYYWDLMQKYLGVAPPVERADKAIDFSQKFYSYIENSQQATKFAIEVMGYQIYESLCKKSGEFVKDDETHLLHHCNFYNSKEAGKTLKSMMELDAKKPWKQILGQVTGNDNRMTARAMLEYFEPLQKWLHTKNSEYKNTVGW